MAMFLASSLYAVNYPRPQKYVNDYAGVINSQTHYQINERLAFTYRRGGPQVLVVIVDSLQGLTIEEFANGLFHDARIGRKGIDDGVLYLIAPRERKIRIEVGRGLEGILTDAWTSRTIRESIVPLLKHNDYNSAVETGANLILNKIGNAKFSDYVH
jgi:uncharacterized protein